MEKYFLLLLLSTYKTSLIWQHGPKNKIFTLWPFTEETLLTSYVDPTNNPERPFACPRALPTCQAKEVKNTISPHVQLFIQQSESSGRVSPNAKFNVRDGERAYLVGTVVSGHDPATLCCLPLLPGNRGRRTFQACRPLLLVTYFLGWHCPNLSPEIQVCFHFRDNERQSK